MSFQVENRKQVNILVNVTVSVPESVEINDSFWINGLKIEDVFNSESMPQGATVLEYETIDVNEVY